MREEQPAYLLARGHPETPSGLVLGTQVVMAGALAARPGAGLPGRLYLATDEAGGTLYRDSGTAWAVCGAGAAVGGGWDVAEVRNAPAAQRLGYWESLDGYGATADLTRYLVSGASLVKDGATGRTRLRVTGVTTAGQVRYVALDQVAMQMRAAEDWRFVVVTRLEQAPAGGAVEIYHGWHALSTGLLDGIQLRSTSGGNYFLVCRSGGSETAVDLGVAPSSGGVTLEFRIGGGGTRVQGYVNGVATGSAITTNIPSGLFTVVPCLIDPRVGTVTTAAIVELWGWGWEGDVA